MPAFQLSDAEIRGIAAFLHHEGTGAASVARRIPAEYPVEKLLVGSRGAGEAFFQSHCRRCHSVTGDLAHLATKYKPFELQARIAFPSGRKPTVIVRDDSGKTVKGEEVYQDEFRVTLKDSTGWTHTFKMGPNVTIEDPLHERVEVRASRSARQEHDQPEAFHGWLRVLRRADEEVPLVRVLTDLQVLRRHVLHVIVRGAGETGAEHDEQSEREKAAHDHVL